MKVDVISASAGTGKTWRLSNDLAAALLDGSARPEGVVAITYTTKAAGELESRIRSVLLEKGRADLAARVRDGYLGTIHSVCQRLLREFALEAGLSPYLAPIPDAEREHLFDRALAHVVAGKESHLNELARRLELDDWKALLRDIVSKARENGMDAVALARSSERSRETYQRLLPTVSLKSDAYRADLRAELDTVIAGLEADAASKKAGRDGTARARVASARSVAADFDRLGWPSWKELFQLAGDVNLKSLSAVTGRFVELATRHAESEPFQRDVLELQSSLFELASAVVGTFEAEKNAARVVDFGDMLALAHRLLARPEVQEALRARLDLVLVDEFQDTSPIQLAVAVALGALSERSIWVGDRKQSIFAFQGSDPDLMSAGIAWALQGQPPDILAKSYRSRPALVDLVSELFSAALAPHGFPPEQVRLTAASADPPELAAQAAFETWRWIPPEKPKRGEKRDEAKACTEAHAIAAGVEALLASPPLVRERAGQDQLRPAARRDVAVLARDNARCREIAFALRERGIPARVSLQGLAQEPEALLVRAALSLLADSSDGVAALEVSWLGGGAGRDPDAWLSRRLVEIATWRKERAAAADAGQPRPDQPLPFSDDPRVAALRATATSHLSPAEALDVALRAAGIPELLRTWPEPQRRLANVEALRAAARAYEELCAVRHGAATVLGLVQHLSELGDDAAQAAPSSDDAVHVTTWHGSKGLEWPVVILSQLDVLKDRSAFEVTVEPAEAFDIAAPLAGRWVRYWPWPYAKMSKGIALLDAAARSPEAARGDARDARERPRLLYVGFTRARDLLVFVAKCDGAPATASLEPLDDERGRSRIALPFAAPQGMAEVRVDEHSWPCVVREHSGIRPAPMARVLAPVAWYAPGARVARPPERLNPSVEGPPASRTGKARLVAVAPLGARGRIAARSEQMGPLGDALHGFLAADRGEAAPAGERWSMAERLIDGQGVRGAIDPRTLIAASDALRAWLDGRFPGALWRREWPVRARIAGEHERLLVGEVDLFLELADGFVLVDHKSFPGDERERDRRVVEEWAPQLGWYAETLASALGKPLLAAFIHLPIRGEMAEIELG